ncbi:hypothetical protein BB561_004375 [Smittium simulii]|uniref:Exocyst complex component EXOC6/Sec15 N-terminal domain-containing protein n=1 Tax=Smittium simulii TaxID=133385 RepID=A0A2T9YGM6_9FUNG|nr:hypothetical protein BB561_004375 [Smittium simulii]
MADTIQQQLQQLVILPETTKKKLNTSLAVESWQAGGSGALNARNDDVIEQLGPIIQSAYRTEKEELFKKQVDLFIAKKDAEIMKICGDHHQQFVESLGQLLGIRQNASELQNKIIELNNQTQFSGQELLETKKILLQLKKQHRNIELAIETTKNCNQVVFMFAEFDQQIQAKSYYEAIKTFETAKNLYAQRSNVFDLNGKIAQSFPIMENDLKNAALGDMREWLFGLKTNIRNIGRHLSSKMASRQLNWERRKNNYQQSDYVSPAVQFVLDEEAEDDEKLHVDLKPLYMCLYVHKKLGYQAEFSKSYTNDRKAQISLIMSPNTDYFSKDLNKFENLLSDIIGFFIIENSVILSAPDFRPKTDVDVLWDCVVDTLSNIIAKNIQHILGKGETSTIIKSLLISFIFVMEEYSFDIQKLRELINALFVS